MRTPFRLCWSPVALYSLGLLSLPWISACSPARAHEAEQAATAHNAGPPPGGKARRRAKAIEACKGKKEGQACKIVFGEHERSGTCQPFRDGQLACIPKQAEERRKRARQACKGKAAGDACQVQGRNGKLEGTCIDTPQGLMCRPRGRR
jgi:hypothetical protein